MGYAEIKNIDHKKCKYYLRCGELNDTKHNGSLTGGVAGGRSCKSLNTLM